MKKRIWKRWMAFVLTLVIVAAGTMALPVQKPVMAATAHMKKMPVTWDLKNNKMLTYKTKWVCGWKNEKVKMTNYKLKNASKKGYKQASFKITFTRSWLPTSEEVDMSQFFTKKGGYVYDTVVDYQTGKVPSKKKVTVKESEWKWEYETCYGETSS